MSDKPELGIDTPPEQKLEALEKCAKHFGAGSASLICRDKEGKLLSVSIYAEGRDAESLERWLKQHDPLNRSVEDLPLSIRAYNLLKNARIETVAELVLRTEEDLRDERFGKKQVNEVKEVLADMGLSLAQ